MISHSDHYDKILREIEEEFPDFCIVEKQSHRLSHWIDWFLKAITFGGQRTYLTRYHTVLGSTLYVAATYRTMDAGERYVLLCHERVHLRQRRRLTFLGMAFLYLIPFFPLGLAYGRARLEWEAYCATLRARAELYGIDSAKDATIRYEIVERFRSADYGWMWPFPRVVGRWYDVEIARIESHVGPPSTM